MSKSTEWHMKAIAALTMGQYLECKKMAAMWERLETQLKAR